MSGSAGHQLMAVNIDRQLVSLMLVQITEAFSTFLRTSGNEYIVPASSLSAELEALVCAAYYTLSFASSMPSTPGMKVVGLTLEPASAVAYAVLVCSYEGVKLSLRKISEIATQAGWSSRPEGTFERRTHTVITKLHLAAKLLGLLSFLAFLYQGDYPELFYRVSELKMSRNGSGVSGGAGYSSAQLFVEGKKALWLALLGASAAASVTVDWQSLRYVAYHYAQLAVTALGRLRGRRAAAAGSSEGGESSQRSAAAEAPSSVAAERHVCAVCGLSPPEMPHSLDCGHVCCYMCAHPLLYSPSSASSGTFWPAGGVPGPASARSGGKQCPTCFRPVSTLQPVGVTPAS